MAKYTIYESEQFLKDVEEAATWILETNLEQSESLALKKLEDFDRELNSLKVRISEFPESGEEEAIRGVRKFPVYNGRYSSTWIFNESQKTVTMISLSDSKYPKKLRTFVVED